MSGMNVFKDVKRMKTLIFDAVYKNLLQCVPDTVTVNEREDTAANFTDLLGLIL